jgi:hypothetical protein
VESIIYTLIFTLVLTYSFAIEQSAFYGHDDGVDALLEDGRSDPSSGSFKVIKDIVPKARTSATHRAVLSLLTNYYRDKYIDYKTPLGTSLWHERDELLSFRPSSTAQSQPPTLQTN